MREKVLFQEQAARGVQSLPKGTKEDGITLNSLSSLSITHCFPFGFTSTKTTSTHSCHTSSDCLHSSFLFLQTKKKKETQRRQ